MRSRLLLNLALLLAIIGLALLVIYEPGKQPEPTLPKLTGLKPQDVSTIHIQRVTTNPVTLYKHQEIWYMREPYKLPANDFRVQSLLRLLQTESHAQHDLSKLDPAKYGLDKPRATITFNDKLKIEFGNTESLSKQRYVRIGNTLHLIVDTFYYQAASPATGYASHAILPPGKITALQLPDMQLTLKDGHWQLQPPREDRSADVLTELIDNWQSAQAIQLKPFEAKNLPKVDIQVTLSDQKQPIRYSLQKTGDDISLLRQDVRMRYFISEDTLNQLTKLPAPTPKPVIKPAEGNRGKAAPTDRN